MTIANKAMFADLTQRIWQAASADRMIASKVEQDHAAEFKSMRVVKQLAPREKLLPIHRIADYGAAQHKKMTLPGVMDGQRLLATRMFDQYAMTQSEIRESFHSVVKDFSNNVYPEVLHYAPRRLGAAFREEDFPKVDRIMNYFSYELRFAPVPDGNNWLLDDLSEDAQVRLRNEVENEKNALFRDAAKNLMARMREVLENLVGQIDTFDENAMSGKLRDVTIAAVKDMAELTGQMNFTGDPVIEAAAKDMMEHFSNLEGADLRHNKETRTKVSELTKKILERLKG